MCGMTEDARTDDSVTDISDLLRGWELSLLARNLSKKTIRSYLETAKLFRESWSALVCQQR